jgi:hypothetical protein
MELTEATDIDRIIGVRHQRKETKAGEIRPTRLAVFEGGEVSEEITIENNQGEIDFALGRYPKGFDYAPAGADLSKHPSHHITEWKIRSNQDPADFTDRLTETRDDGEYAFKVPTGYVGLQPGDLIVMFIGGSGDLFAHALSREAEEIGATVRRVPPFRLNGNRLIEDKSRDAENLVHLHNLHPDWFYTAQATDRKIMELRETLKEWLEAMDARKKCKQRLRQRTTRSAYLSENGQYPELTLKGQFQKARANNDLLASIKQEESQRLNELEDVTQQLTVYQKVFEPVQGISVRIAARIIAGIQEIRRFATAAKLKAYCGVDVRNADFRRPDSGEQPPELGQGVFPRRKKGHVANWQDMARQGLYLFREQLPRQPGSKWGDKYRHFKQKFAGQDKHSDWSDGAIDTKAKWRTVTRFVRDHIYPQWMELAESRDRKEQA